jgi:hypothetical protein
MVSEVDGEVAVEVAIGREGMAGLPVFLGVTASPNTVRAGPRHGAAAAG